MSKKQFEKFFPHDQVLEITGFDGGIKISTANGAYFTYEHIHTDEKGIYGKFHKGI